jgi:anti-sigma factor RsiW
VSDVTDLTCREMVELVTDYLEGALPAPERVRFEEHLAGCEGCSHHLEQMRTTIRVTGTLDEDAFPAGQLDGLIQAFRGWRV